ncbi:major facilitator superfamily domain-containing protein [Radiomyces spectabilis]|uniref:major facilitator superfamily domain-containing protein n=1 Tax=Radiomyces spectabilis TaxID=64574 RepID=UPI00221F5E34|nr:major facilitator superfamily domain-containing protein [Radiomyces spectabilis]KAI8391624.1 major facilitator superfamily domain-containing protein [Radiomyces spectabilis]
MLCKRSEREIEKPTLVFLYWVLFPFCYFFFYFLLQFSIAMAAFFQLKLLYILLYSLYGSALAYISLFYDGVLHLTRNEIGFLLSIAPFVQVFACPLWTFVADRKPAAHGFLMAGLACIGGGCVLVLPLLPCLGLENPLALTAALAFGFAFFGSPVCALVDSAVLKILADQRAIYGNQRMWGSLSNGLHILTVGFVISQFGINTAFLVFGLGLVGFILLSLCIRIEAASTEDTEAVRPLLSNMDPTRSRFGYKPAMITQSRRSSSADSVVQHYASFRRGSLVSHANTVYVDDRDDGRFSALLRLSTTTTAALDAQLEAEAYVSQMNTPVPPLGLALSQIPTVDTSLAVLATLQLPTTTESEGSMLRSWRVWSFFITVFLYGIAFSMINQFLFLILHNDLDMSSSLIGWTGPLGGLAEMLTFWISKQLFERFSVVALMTMAHLTFMIRGLVYITVIPGETISQCLCLAMQLFNGLSYALLWSTSVFEVDTLFPGDQRAIAQGILAALNYGLGYGVGCLAGGFLYENYGYVWLVQVAVAVTAVSLVVFILGHLRHS